MLSCGRNDEPMARVPIRTRFGTRKNNFDRAFLAVLNEDTVKLHKMHDIDELIFSLNSINWKFKKFNCVLLNCNLIIYGHKNISKTIFENYKKDRLLDISKMPMVKLWRLVNLISENYKETGVCHFNIFDVIIFSNE